MTFVYLQIENEYGSYFACDHQYMSHLRDKARTSLGPRAVLYTTDGGADGFLKCGAVKGAYATVDFGNTGRFKYGEPALPRGKSSMIACSIHNPTDP
jgi:hypothetical protein